MKRRLPGWFFLTLGLILGALPASAQQASRLEHWHTGGVGLSTPLGFHLGATYSIAVRDPLFIQITALASKDPYITRHSVYAVGPAIGLRRYSQVALTSLSVGPAFIHGTRGADLLAPGTAYSAAALSITAQLLFRETNIGAEVFTNLNPIRNVSGLRIIYRLGRIR